LINSFVLRHSDYAIQREGAAQEGQRLQVPRAFLQQTIPELNDNRQGCMVESVSNLEEVGISDWEDRKTKRVVIAPPIFDQIIPHGVSQNVQHIAAND
jgi:hypothetical protein